MTAFDQLGTEARDAAGADLDLRTTRELVELMNTADATVPTAVAGASTQVAALIDAVVTRLAAGGRLVYAGAGTSGRLAALDAAECGPTFGAGDVVLAVSTEQESEEDDAEAGARAITALGVSTADAVVGISASGRSPYVLAAVSVARERGALGHPGEQLADALAPFRIDREGLALAHAACRARSAARITSSIT